MRALHCFAALMFLFNTPVAVAGAATTGPRVGDPAPALVNATWLRGTPVPSWQQGKVYVLDIWAPWCGPCVGGMQHLTDLQMANQSRGLVIVGLTGNDEYGSTLAKAKEVLKKKGAAVGYSIAWDEGHHLYDVWMAREKNEGWPWSFVIGRDGRVAFIGHPEKLDAVLDAILAGTYDIEDAARRYRSRCKALDLVQDLATARKNEQWRTAQTIFDRILATDRGVAGTYVSSEYRMLAVNLRDSQKAAVFGRQMIGTYFPDDPDVLSALADTIVDPKSGAQNRDYALARRCAERADALVGGGRATKAATLARVYFAADMIAEAISAQERVVRLSEEPDRNTAETVLAQYVAARSHTRSDATPETRGAGHRRDSDRPQP